MIKVINPFNKKMDEVYTAANICQCNCSTGTGDISRASTQNIGREGYISCSCGYGTTSRVSIFSM